MPNPISDWDVECDNEGGRHAEPRAQKDISFDKDIERAAAHNAFVVVRRAVLITNKFKRFEHELVERPVLVVDSYLIGCTAIN